MNGSEEQPTDREQRAGKKPQSRKVRPKQEPKKPKPERTGPYDDPHRRPA